jgi:hypothetical protein
MLFGSIHLPDFPVQAAIRHEIANVFKFPLYWRGPIHSRRRSYAIICTAVRNHNRDKKTELQVLSGVVMRKRSCEEEAGAQAALMDCGHALSPEAATLACLPVEILNPDPEELQILLK